MALLTLPKRIRNDLQQFHLPVFFRNRVRIVCGFRSGLAKPIALGRELHFLRILGLALRLAFADIHYWRLLVRLADGSKP